MKQQWKYALTTAAVMSAGLAVIGWAVRDAPTLSAAIGPALGQGPGAVDLPHPDDDVDR